MMVIFDDEGWGKSQYTGNMGATFVARAGAIEVPDGNPQLYELVAGVPTLRTAEERWAYDHLDYDGPALRSAAYRAEADPLLAACLAYEREGDTVNAAAQEALWAATKVEIRELYPDTAPAYVAQVVEETETTTEGTES
jgi:hypothetical protein